MKKILTVLLMLTCVFGLTACGNEAKSKFYFYTETYGEGFQAAIGDATVNVLDYFSINAEGVTDEDVELWNYFPEDILEEIGGNFYQSFGFKTTGNAVRNGIVSYRSAIEELGTVEVQADAVEYVEKDKELIVSVPLKGSLHDGTFEVIYNNNLEATSFTTNVSYSLAESMQKAAMNTAIGMGTVFVMLIIIMFIIYGFAVIPKIQASLEAKKNAKTTTEASVDNAIQGIVEREEEVADDLELIAVIAAAIAASEGATSTDGFVVRSIKRIR